MLAVGKRRQLVADQSLDRSCLHVLWNPIQSLTDVRSKCVSLKHKRLVAFLSFKSRIKNIKSIFTYLKLKRFKWVWFGGAM